MRSNWKSLLGLATLMCCTLIYCLLSSQTYNSLVVESKAIQPGNSNFDNSSHLYDNRLPESNASSSKNRLFSTIENFLITPDVCHYAGRNLTLIIVVSIARNRFFHRDTIRKTWGNYGSKVNISTALMFTLGGAKIWEENPQVQQKILDESAKHKDILLVDFIDDYHNLTLKVLSSLRYVTHFCGHVKYVIKTDDDVYVNIPLLVSVLREHSKSRPSQMFTIGRVKRQVKPSRNVEYKWYSPEDEFPAKIYPDYNLGFSYAMPSQAAAAIDKVAPALRYFWIDDIFVTGIAARSANVEIIHDARFVGDPRGLWWWWTNPLVGKYFYTNIAVHDITWSEMGRIHTEFTNLTKHSIIY